MPSILCSNTRAPVAQLVRASDRNSEDPGSNPGWISMSFFTNWSLLLVNIHDSLHCKQGMLLVNIHSLPCKEGVLLVNIQVCNLYCKQSSLQKTSFYNFLQCMEDNTHLLPQKEDWSRVNDYIFLSVYSKQYPHCLSRTHLLWRVPSEFCSSSMSSILKAAQSTYSRPKLPEIFCRNLRLKNCGNFNSTMLHLSRSYWQNMIT